MNFSHFDNRTLPVLIGLIVTLSILVPHRPRAFAGQDQNAVSAIPSWIEKEQWREDDIRVVVLRTEGFLLQSHATMALVDLVRKKVREEIDLLVHNGASEMVSLPESYVEANLVKDELILDSRQLNPSFAGREKYYGFAKLHFSAAFRSMIEDRYQRNFRTGRLTWTGVLTATVLGWLAVVWAYLRLDQMTRHFYSRRLQTGAIVLAVVILAVAIIALLSLDQIWHDPPG